MARSHAARSLSQSAAKTIILTDSSKFQARGLVTEFSVNEISQVYTDRGLELKQQKLLE